MLWGGVHCKTVKSSLSTALFLALILFCTFLCTTFISCAGGAGSPKGSGAEGTSLAIRLPNTGAKTLYEKDDIVTFTVTISSGSYNSTKTASKGETMMFSDIPVGTYSVTAYGKIADGSIAAKCVTSVKIVAGETTTTTLHLARLDYYVVTFKNEDGSEISHQNVTTGYTVPKPADPTKTGYNFSGWRTSTTATTSFDFNTPITSHTDLFATFGIKTYKITFNYNGGTVGTATSTTLDVNYNTSPTVPSATLTRTAPDGSSYTFKNGWNVDKTAADAGTVGTLDNATEDKTYYAVWEPKVKVTFDYNGGTNSGNTKKEVYPNKDTAPDVPAASEEPAWANHKFKGWASASNATVADNTVSSTPVSADTTYYAVWLPAYNITYVSEPYAVNSTNFPTKVTYTSDEGLVSLPNPSKSGFTFDGWYTDAAFTPANKVTSIDAGTTGDVTLYAKWTVAVHMSPNNGTDDATTYNVVYNKSFNESVPDVIPESMANDLTKTGATFGGWYKTSSAVPPTTWPSTAFDKTAPITKETYLHAKWNVTVTFDSNGGSAVPAQTVVCGQKATKPTDPTKTGVLPFAGWYTSDDGGTTLSSEAYDFDTAVTENLTLYADWALTVNNLSTYLSSLPAGSTASPNVLPSITGLTTSNWGQISTALRANKGKYVDLSATALPEGITSMESGFYDCSNLIVAPAIPDGVTSMKECFERCSNLKEAPTIPDGVTNMYECFLNCFALRTAPAIPNSVTDMNCCFFTCKSLTEAPTIPDGVTDIRGCFNDCHALRTAPAIPNSVTYMSTCFAGCENITTAPVIPDGVTNLYCCFSGCSKLTAAPMIPDGVTNMNRCFEDCSKLTAAPVIPDGVTNMSCCFDGCSKLTAAPMIPDRVTNMSGCFRGCSSLTGEIVINAVITDSEYWSVTFKDVPSSVTIKVKKAGSDDEDVKNAIRSGGSGIAADRIILMD